MDGDSGTGLPASIEAAWGLRERPAKGPKPGLTLQRIVEAGVQVAATQGLPAVSMSRVAAELGASTMALYRYVKSKDELLMLMVDAAYGPPPAAPAPDEGWRDGLSRWAWAELTAIRRQPWVLRVRITTPPVAPNEMSWLEIGLRCLRDTGLAAAEKLSTIMLVSGYVRNWATLTNDLVEAALASGTTPQEAMSGYAQTLAKLVDPARFPEVSALIEAGAMNDEGEPMDAEFVFGLERVLDGVEALVRART
jgi:AcrR family transcriptional regulator